MGWFRGPLNRLTDLSLDRLPDTEPVRPEALAAAGELGIAGVARLIRDENAPSAAEVAIVIADDWQHQGGARLMLERPKFR